MKTMAKNNVKTKPVCPADLRADGNGNGAASPLEELKRLFDFMKANGLQAFELDRKDYHVRLVRRASTPVPVPVAMVAQPAVSAAPAAAGSVPAAPAAPAAPALPANAFVLKAPMMGIFYRSSSPSSPPFAKEGGTVKAGDVICLLEAMKVFNDVKAEVDGVIVRFCVDNGKPVKVGQDLCIIERK